MRSLPLLGLQVRVRAVVLLVCFYLSGNLLVQPIFDFNVPQIDKTAPNSLACHHHTSSIRFLFT